jgi:hypothetical protein
MPLTNTCKVLAVYPPATANCVVVLSPVNCCFTIPNAGDQYIPLPLEINTDFDVEKAIKSRLIQALGLNIMQGNIDEALNKFVTESTKYNFHYHPIDFRLMNSFMTFKNFYRAEDVKKVLSDYPKFYADFFSKTNFSSQFQKKACYYVFEFHLKNSNLLKYHFL